MNKSLRPLIDKYSLITEDNSPGEDAAWNAIKYEQQIIKNIESFVPEIEKYKAIVSSNINNFRKRVELINLVKSPEYQALMSFIKLLEVDDPEFDEEFGSEDTQRIWKIEIWALPKNLAELMSWMRQTPKSNALYDDTVPIIDGVEIGFL